MTRFYFHALPAQLDSQVTQEHWAMHSFFISYSDWAKFYHLYLSNTNIKLKIADGQTADQICLRQKPKLGHDVKDLTRL